MGTVLITGGTGLIGTHLGRSLADAGQQVVLTYRRTWRTPQLLANVMESKVKTVRCDVMDLPALSRAIHDYDVDSIIHTATVAEYDTTVYTIMQTNVVGTLNVMEAAAMGSVKRVIYMTSGNVPPVEEESIPISSLAGSALSPSKKCAVVVVAYYGAEYGIPVTIVNGDGSFWGPYDTHMHRNQIIMRAIMDGVTAGKPVDLPNVGSEEKISIMYAGDVAAGITVLHLASEPKHLLYKIPGGGRTTWGEIAEAVKEFIPGATINFGKSDQQAREPQPLPEDLNIVTEFGFKPKYGWKGGLKEYIEWYKNGQL